MSHQAVNRMSSKEFLDWGLHQELSYELVDGNPVPRASVTQLHDRIVANVHGLLYNLLRGQKCSAFTAAIAVQIPAGNIRRPDAGIDCGTFDPDEAAAVAPFLVFEVLSRSTRDFDMSGKLEEYKTVPTLAHIVIVDPDTPQVFHWTRSQNEPWRDELLAGLDAFIRLPEFDGIVDLADLYEGVTFRMSREGGSST
jgi:Uma2 family endonuclease